MRALLLALAVLAGPARAQEAAPPPPPPQQSAIPIGPSNCGLVTHYASHVIPDGCYQSALNVTFDADLGVQRRLGYGRFNGTALSTPTAIRRTYQFDAPDGSHYIVAVSSDKLWYASNAGNFTALTGTLSPTEKTSCTQVLGKLWCVNKVNGLLYWDGIATSTTAVSAGPLGGLIGNFRNRVLVADVASNQSRLYASGYLDGTDWTTASFSTSPFIQPITGVNDGEKVTCLMGTYGDAYIIGTPNRLFGLYGFDNNDFQLRELSREVGCLENTSVQEFDGSLVWLSRRGIERMQGTLVDWRVSDPIYDVLQTIVGAAGNSVNATDTLQADFQAGNLTASGAGAPMSATISVNNVVPSTWSITHASTTTLLGSSTVNITTTDAPGYLTLSSTTAKDYFADGDYSSNLTWTVTAGAFTVSTTHGLVGASNNVVSLANETAVTIASGSWKFTYYYTTTDTACNANASGTCLDYRFVKNLGNDFYSVRVLQGLASETAITRRLQLVKSVAGVETVLVSSITTFSASADHNFEVVRSTDGRVYLYLESVFTSSTTDTAISSSARTEAGLYYFLAGADNYNNSVGKLEWLQYMSSGTVISSIFDTGMSTPTSGVFNSTFTSSFPEMGIAFYVRSSSSPNNDLWTSWSAASDTLRPTLSKRYVEYQANLYTGISTMTPTLSGVSLSAATTGYFISQCRNPGTAITSWGLFQCDLTIPTNAALSLWVATGTSCGNATSTNAGWTTQANNSVIGIATGAYVAYRALFDFQAASQAVGGIALQACTINWNEGAARPETASAVIDHKYHLFYTTVTTSGAVNDHALMLDYKDRWALWDDMPATSAVTFTSAHGLIIGDGSASGKLYRLYSGYDDAGASFTSGFRTKDFDAGDWKMRKELRGAKLEFSPLRDAGDSVTMTVTAHVDKVQDNLLNTVRLAEDTGIVYGRVPTPLDSQVSGRYIGFDVSNTGTQHWKFYRAALQYRPLRED